MHVKLLVVKMALHSSQRHESFRSIWAETCARDEKEAILGVQQARNAMTACTYMATITAVLATAGITVILDPAKTDRMRELSVSGVHNQLHNIQLDDMPPRGLAAGSAHF
jgi:hypothetical protein